MLVIIIIVYAIPPLLLLSMPLEVESKLLMFDARTAHMLVVIIIVLRGKFVIESICILILDGVVGIFLFEEMTVTLSETLSHIYFIIKN